MAKRNVNISVTDFIHDRAKEKGMNVSDVAEQAIKAQLNIEEVEIHINPTHCEFCNKKDTKATAKNPNEGLTWLWPDERWICQSCLRHEGGRGALV